MEPWIFYAIISIFVTGIHNFIFKIVAERKYNNYLFTFYDYLFGTIVLGFYLLYKIILGELVIDNFWLITLFAGINVTFFSFSLFSRVESMRNIDTVIFYPLYKTFGPIFITLLGIFLFKESLNMKEIFGIVLGICVPLMLLTKSENRIQKNLFLGVILVVVTSLLTTVSTWSIKANMFYNLNIEIFLFMSFLIGVFVTAISNKLHNHDSRKKYNDRGMIGLALVTSIIHIMGFLFFTLAMSGTMAVAFTINSFSILIPIILSIIFYGEHFNMRKGIVILLSIVSILMFL